MVCARPVLFAATTRVSACVHVCVRVLALLVLCCEREGACSYLYSRGGVCLAMKKGQGKAVGEGFFFLPHGLHVRVGSPHTAALSILPCRVSASLCSAMGLLPRRCLFLVSSRHKVKITEADRGILTLKTQRRKIQDAKSRVRLWCGKCSFPCACFAVAASCLVFSWSHPSFLILLLFFPFVFFFPPFFSSSSSHLSPPFFHFLLFSSFFFAQCERQIERETVVAKTLVAQGELSRARLALRKRKLQRSQLEQLEQYLLTVEGVILDVEGAQRAARVTDALRAGTAALREVHKTISLEDVEQLMAETAEANEYQTKLADALAGQLSADQEREAEKELEKLEQELIAQKVLDMPEVPTTVPAPRAQANAQQARQQESAGKEEEEEPERAAAIQEEPMLA